MLEKIMAAVCGKPGDEDEEIQNEGAQKITGSVVLMKKKFYDMSGCFGFNLFEKGVSLQLVSAEHSDTTRESKGKLGKKTYLEKSNSRVSWSKDEEEYVHFKIIFEWDESFGVPGAFIIKNNLRDPFYLKIVTLNDVPTQGHHLHFVCNSWVYPTHRYTYDRIFFINKSYLPSDTPEPLRPYREEELNNLRGDGSGILQKWDRVYDYAYYNDLGRPDKGPDYARPVLGGSTDYPYPRRGRTGRLPNKYDSKTESRLKLCDLNIYVPRDERFTQVKFSDFVAYAFKSLGQVLVPEIASLFHKSLNGFDSFQDVFQMYEGGIPLPNKEKIDKVRKRLFTEFFKELVRNDGEAFLKFPMPDVIKENKTAWRTDEEFGREMLAGVNPVIIRLLKEFPPASKLDPEIYGDQTSSITTEHIEKNLNGQTIDEALTNNKLFILDHHDSLMPYLARINSTATKMYASRTLLLLQDDGTLKPLAIELSLPHPQGENHGATSQVFTPAQHEHGVEASIWQLAKAYAAVCDSGYHQLISHFLNTHAVIEPFVISTNRNLSVLHPMYKLLQPHFRDTMNINALARHTLINAGGILELTVFPAKYAMEMSAVIYKNWVLPEQALPAELIKRGVAVPDSTQPHGLKLLIEDYPYAVDGLEIWSAINEWVNEYCSFYYKTDEMVQSDTELQLWWSELRDIGHGDLKDEPWWPKMQTKSELIDTCTIIIWVASALHAAVNFGQYPYAGYLPCRPTLSRRFMPEQGTPEYDELERNPDLAFLKTITPQLQTLIGVSLIEILSRHTSDEIYLGQRDTVEWTSDNEPREAFDKFSAKLIEIEKRIDERNNDPNLRNRCGPVKVPYTLLYPNTSNPTDDKKEVGLTGRGIPNSISI